MKGRGLRPFDVALTAIVSASNFVASFYLAPLLTAFIPHVFVGAFLMVPLDLFLAYFVWATTRKRTFTLYFVVYGLLTMPTTIWGSTPGLFKPLLGAAIGLTLDLLAGRFSPEGRERYGLAAVFALIYWAFTGAMWMLVGLPIVQLFQGMLGAVPALKPVAQLGFAATFTAIALMTVPSSIVAVNFAVTLANRVRRDFNLN